MEMVEPPAGAAFMRGTAEFAAKLHRMEQAVRVLLEGIGEDIGREGLLDTPKRVAKAFLDMTEGYRQPLHRVLGDAFFHEAALSKSPGGLVMVRDIDFAALSEETLLPFHGRVHIAYMPSNGVVLGLSKLARLTRAASKQLQSPQCLALQIIAVLEQQLAPQGVAVVIEAKHLSFNVTQPQTAMQLVTSGCFNQPELQLLPELLAMLDLQQQQVQYVVAAPACTSSIQSLRAACGPAPFALQHALTQHCLDSSSGRDSPPLAPITPDPSEDSDSDQRSDGTEPCEHEQLFCSDFPNESMESALHQLLAEAGVDVAQAAVQASIRRYVLSLLAATSGYHQEYLANSSSSSSSSGSMPNFSPQAVVHQQPSSGASAAAWPRLESATGNHGGGQHGHCSSCTCCGSSASLAQQLAQLQPAEGTNTGSQLVEGGGSLLQLSATQPDNMSNSNQQQQQLEHHHLPFISQCEHHMLPFYGTVHVALLCTPQQQQQQQTPEGQPGAAAPRSSMEDEAAAQLRAAQVAQIVAAYTQRLQVQERITQQVAEGLQELLGVADVMVVVRAAHMCMVARGVENHAGTTVTRAVTGVFVKDPVLRTSFLRAATLHSTKHSS